MNFQKLKIKVTEIKWYRFKQSPARGIMTKLALISLLAVVSIGCSKTHNITDNYNLPDELKDCKFYRVEGFNGASSLRVVRCPNSSTSTTYGKNQTTIVIED